MRFMHELILSGIGPPRSLFARFLQMTGITVLIRVPVSIYIIMMDTRQNYTYKSNNSVSFTRSGGMDPVNRLSFSSLKIDGV
jgi:hypothetical protein